MFIDEPGNFRHRSKLVGEPRSRAARACGQSDLSGNVQEGSRVSSTERTCPR